MRVTSGAAAGGALSTLPAADAVAARVAPDGADPETFAVDREAATSVFPQSVASGGPTPRGALLWTRVDPEAYDDETPLAVEVARDEAFDDTVYNGLVPPDRFGPERDHTAIADVDGELEPDSRYFYRFVHDGDASEVGRCRTLPEPGASPDSLRLAVASCNDYRHGYFGAFGHIAETDVDFLVHLGDFIYEYGGEDGPDDRAIDLPSGEDQAEDLADFRHLYRTYRSDDDLRSALRNHTMIHTWDDHEIVEDRWWNYETEAPETDKHPRGDDPEFMRELYTAGIRAYTEYVPARVEYDPPADDGSGLSPEAIKDNFRLYRSFRFGDLAALFMTDERLYRSPPPGPDDSDPAVSAKTAAEEPGRTMLGEDQRQWLLDGMTTSNATWTLWGNEVLAAAFRFVDGGEVTVNADAWDGYRSERERVLTRLEKAGVDNLVALTGDMHSYLAAYLLTDYELVGGDEGLSDIGPGERTGVEFMAPAVSSDNLVALGEFPENGTETVVGALKAGNPHVEWFDSSHWGYAVVDVRTDRLVYSAYHVDRDSPDASRELLRRYRVPAGSVELQRTDDGAGDDGFF
ncbi:alkaline phosphatase D family protein [Halorussus sp. JP-T4]|nr:alkaline phosphatase D family protein [Halorussus sp. JP-T4]